MILLNENVTIALLVLAGWAVVLMIIAIVVVVLISGFENIFKSKTISPSPQNTLIKKYKNKKCPICNGAKEINICHLCKTQIEISGNCYSDIEIFCPTCGDIDYTDYYTEHCECCEGTGVISQ